MMLLNKEIKYFDLSSSLGQYSNNLEKNEKSPRKSLEKSPKFSNSDSRTNYIFVDSRKIEEQSFSNHRDNEKDNILEENEKDNSPNSLIQ